MVDRNLVRIVGDCVLSNVGSHVSALAQALHQEGPITLDLSETGTIDVSFIQFVTSAAQTAAQRHRPFWLIGMSDAVKSSFHRAGVDLGSMSAAKP